jgi:hypothetical protein
MDHPSVGLPDLCLNASSMCCVIFAFPADNDLAQTTHSPMPLTVPRRGITDPVGVPGDDMRDLSLLDLLSPTEGFWCETTRLRNPNAGIGL